MREVANKYEAVRERKRTECTVTTTHASYRRARRWHISHIALRGAKYSVKEVEDCAAIFASWVEQIDLYVYQLHYLEEY